MLFYYKGGQQKMIKENCVKDFINNNCQSTKEMTQKSELLAMDKMEAGSKGIIYNIPEHSLLAPLGFREGKTVEIVGQQTFGGPIIASIEGRNVAIGRELAQKIKVKNGVPCYE